MRWSRNLARPREFDDVAAIRRMTLTFWKRGYQATSMRDLEDATGLTVGSLYKAFASKKEIFRLCVDQYMVEQSYLAILQRKSAAPLTDALAAVMDAVIESVDPPVGRATGCLVTNLAGELSLVDPELGHDAAGRLAAMQAALHARVSAAQAAGELSMRHDPEALASYLMTVLQGLLVISTTTRDVSNMRRTRDLALELVA